METRGRSRSGVRQWFDLYAPAGLELDVEREAPEKSGADEGIGLRFRDVDLVRLVVEEYVADVHRNDDHPTIGQTDALFAGLGQAQSVDPVRRKGQGAIVPVSITASKDCASSGPRISSDKAGSRSAVKNPVVIPRLPPEGALRSDA